jgi:hypothetical protein
MEKTKILYGTDRLDQLTVISQSRLVLIFMNDRLENHKEFSF